MFNSKEAIEINKKLLITKLLEEQQKQIRINEAIQEAQKQKIDEWFKNVMSEIKPWTKEQRAFYEKHTFSPDEKSSERYNRLMTNTWKKLENR